MHWGKVGIFDNERSVMKIRKPIMALSLLALCLNLGYANSDENSTLQELDTLITEILED